MAGKIEARVPRGMRDILPEQMIRRQYVMDIVETVFEQFGFEPLQTSAMELAETLMGKYGPDAEKLIYTANHPGGKDELALRYDLSVPLSRVAAMYTDLPTPFKRYHIAPVWRAERPQKGRYREFYQCDVDTVGTSSMLADAEIINVVYAVLHRLGFPQFTIHLNNRKILNGIGQYSGVADDKLGDLYRSIDKLDKIGMDGVKAELEKNDIAEAVINRLLALLEIRGENRAILADLSSQLADYPEAIEGITELTQIIDYLDAVDISTDYYAIDFAMVRGMAYYTGPIFETTVEEPKMPSISGGGRYDELIGLFAKKSQPATGVSLGIERIIGVMEELDMYPPEVGRTVTQLLVTQFDDSLQAETVKLADMFRQAGINVELQFDNVKLLKQFIAAEQKGIRYAAILGPDELAAGQVAIRDLTTREQQTFARDEVAGIVKQWLAGQK